VVVFGGSGAATGFMFIGIASAIAGGHDTMMNLGWVLLVGGLIATVIGMFWYRATEARMARDVQR